jgi:hypothetical protein
MNFYELNNKFQNNVMKEGIDNLLLEVGDARQFQLDLIMKFDNTKSGSMEDKLIRLRSIEGVTIVDTREPDQFNNYKTRIKFHPRLDSVRPITYLRTVLIPQIRTASIGAGITIVKIIPNSLINITK